MLGVLKGLFTEACKSKKPTYGFRFGNNGFVFQAKVFFDSLCHDECEKPTLFDLKASDQIKVRILKSKAGIPVSRDLVEQVESLVTRLGLASGKLLKKCYSVEGLFNSNADARVSMPGHIILKKDRRVEMEIQLFNPTLLFATHSIFSAAGNAIANSKLRKHPLSKLASMLNQLFGITVVPHLNMMAQLLALACEIHIGDINKMKKSKLTELIAGKLDLVLRHVVFALKFRFLKFEKADEL